MAFPGDAIAEAEAAAKRRRRRISDYLGDSDGDGDAVASPPSPRLRLPRFTCARIRFGRLGRKRGGGGGRKEVAAAEKSKDASVDSPAIAGRRQAAGSSNSGASAEAGMGLSMLLFLAKTRVELNRMAEVRAQMEALLKEMRDEACKMKSADHAVVVAPRTCNLQPSSSTTKSASSSCTSDTNTNCHTIASSGAAIARGEVREKPSEDEGCARRDATDEEVETGLAQCQLVECRWSTEEEASDSSDDEFIELDGGHFTAGNLWADAVDDDDDDGSEESTTDAREGGVSAVELERRLHELRHRRDMERIKKLESALRRAERKLTEKEMEARLWQETAALALRPPPPPARDGL
ncbi:hypothetical protein ACP70R_029732 [Stipagrostis hirtigluma subsp. patula]